MIYQKKFDNLLTSTVDIITKKINEIWKQEKILICLNGDIGCGKTRLVTLISRRFFFDKVTSPTYLFYREYFNHTNKIHMLHIDFYRTRSSQAKLTLLLFDAIEMANIIFVEWNHSHTSFFKKYFNFYEINVNFKSSTNTKQVVQVSLPTVE